MLPKNCGRLLVSLHGDSTLSWMEVRRLPVSCTRRCGGTPGTLQETGWHGQGHLSDMTGSSWASAHVAS